MVQVIFKQPIRIDTGRDHNTHCQAGTSYLLTNFHFSQLPQDNCREAFEYPETHRFKGCDLNGKSLLILWLAGMGDTIAFTPALMSLQAHYPQARIDIISIPVLYEVLHTAGFKGQLLDYPTTVQTIEHYDYFLPMEQFNKHQESCKLDSIDRFADFLFEPAGLTPALFSIDEKVRKRMKLPDTVHPRVGVQVQSLSPLRSYPPDLLAQLLRELVTRQYEVHLLGQAQDCAILSAPPLLHNDCGRTGTFSETVALIEQMDLMVCPDSYLMHLSGALSVPTIALFSTIPANLRASRYPSIISLEPDTPCSPCLAVLDDKCPQGHQECQAMRSTGLSPLVIREKVEKTLEKKFSSNTGTCL